MQTLYSYIHKPLIDGHMHPFDHVGCVQRPPFTQYAVGFPDMWMDKATEYKDMVKLYKKFMPKCPYVKYWCATGFNLDNIKNIYENIADIKGFGELKLYDDGRAESPINRKDIKFAREVVKFSNNNGNLPVYIHYELNNEKEVNSLRSLIETYPETPIVLCHLGMNYYNQEFAWPNILSLMESHMNLWTDISWSGSKWLLDKQILISQIPQDRVIWGSDDSYRRYYRMKKGEKLYLPQEQLKKEYSNSKFVINNDVNIKKLFNDI